MPLRNLRALGATALLIGAIAVVDASSSGLVAHARDQQAPTFISRVQTPATTNS